MEIQTLITGVQILDSLYSVYNMHSKQSFFDIIPSKRVTLLLLIVMCRVTIAHVDNIDKCVRTYLDLH